MNGLDDTSMDPFYKRRIPTGHVSFDELYVKFFGDIPEEQISRISQSESFESLYQKYHDNVEDTSRQRTFDDLYLKYADELQVFSGGDDSIDFVYTLINNSSNVSDATSKHELPQKQSNIIPYQKTNLSISQGNDDTLKVNSTQQIDYSSLTPSPITDSPQKEISYSFLETSEINNPSFSPRSPIIPGKMQRSSMRLNSSSSPKIPSINTIQTGPSRVLHNHRPKSSDSPTPNRSGKKLIDTLKYKDNDSKKSDSKEMKKFSLINNFDDNGDNYPKKKVKLNRSKKT